ncbi:hypothetical protein [Prevotella jejuni]|jgi:hypothetical protein|uniref:hypothetical protein n=1 Tax=Prevotella jejuni TaxID=1177574 RepID=UPI0032119469
METRAIVILYEGIKIPEKMLMKLAQILRKEKIASDRDINISELDQSDISKTLAKAKAAESITFKYVVEKDPTEQAMIYLKGYFGDEIWMNPVLFGVNLMGVKTSLTEEGKTALRILCRDNISSEVSLKYNFTTAHLTAIKAVVTSM